MVPAGRYLLVLSTELMISRRWIWEIINGSVVRHLGLFENQIFLISSFPNLRRTTVHRHFLSPFYRRFQPLFLTFLVALDSLQLALSIDTSLEAKSNELRNPKGPARSCVVHQSNAIIGAVTTGYECSPPSCDGLTGPDDHGPMISRLIGRGIEAT
ncbi:chloroplast envelope membrane protein [Dorcoceras hygrometricum]|uniref:Chloroplast envelope membrane protein n=1 Tax=Dorcoceras hygrometricum TaxID=472368 RepID=A0A2Z7D1K5_9LAMI|nr:chloroplast envelope membrane protein [Dorcoceras hygrometricum]